MEYKFIEWSGTSADMEDTLNALAGDGWRVVQVLESSRLLLLCRPTLPLPSSATPSEDQTAGDSTAAA
jgi:hypothetical protein